MICAEPAVRRWSPSRETSGHTRALGVLPVLALTSRHGLWGWETSGGGLTGAGWSCPGSSGALGLVGTVRSHSDAKGDS